MCTGRRHGLVKGRDHAAHQSTASGLSGTSKIWSLRGLLCALARYIFLRGSLLCKHAGRPPEVCTRLRLVCRACCAPVLALPAFCVLTAT